LSHSDPARRHEEARLAPDVAVAGALPDDIAAGLRVTAERRGAMGADVQWFASIASTNDRALRWAANRAPEGALVGADAQTQGRGRHGRVWESPPGAGIYASLVLRPDARTAALLTLAAGVAIVEGVEAATGLKAGVKWPNDVYVDAGSRAVPGGRKLAGILAEAGVSEAAVQHVVLGFGINVMPSAYPREIAERATSLEGELGRAVDRGLVLGECLAALNRRYQDLRDGRGDRVLATWRARAAATFGRTVEWDGAAGVESGVAFDIDAQGALLVRRPGSTARVVAGEVRWTS
jgi:BirA family biotin operon repressor/biotin-[acetyl-CoA-carboxylase] ligase